MTYSVVIPSRGLVEEKQLYDRTFLSLINQTIKPDAVYVCMNNGVNPVSSVQGITYLNLGQESRYRNETNFMYGIPKINLGLEHCPKENHVMISGDDSEYQANYAKGLLETMERDSTIGIASGLYRENGKIIYVNNPTGSGRFYRNELREKIFPHPYINCGETLFLYQSQLLGFNNIIDRTTCFNHLRPRKSKTVLSDGKACYELGYPLTYTIGRIAKTLYKRKTLQSSLLLGHLTAMLKQEPRANKEVRDLVKWKLHQQYPSLF